MQDLVKTELLSFRFSLGLDLCLQCLGCFEASDICILQHMKLQCCHFCETTLWSLLLGRLFGFCTNKVFEKMSYFLCFLSEVCFWMNVCLWLEEWVWTEIVYSIFTVNKKIVTWIESWLWVYHYIPTHYTRFLHFLTLASVPATRSLSSMILSLIEER